MFLFKIWQQGSCFYFVHNFSKLFQFYELFFIMTCPSVAKYSAINFFVQSSLSSQFYISSYLRNPSNWMLLRRLQSSSSVTFPVNFLCFFWSLLMWFNLLFVSQNFSLALLLWNCILPCRSSISFSKLLFPSFKL